MYSFIRPLYTTLGYMHAAFLFFLFFFCFLYFFPFFALVFCSLSGLGEARLRLAKIPYPIA